MIRYHVLVQQEGDWFVGRVLERPGVTTQGKTLDELVFMLRDAVEAMWGEKSVGLELVLAADVKVEKQKRSKTAGPDQRRSAA